MQIALLILAWSVLSLHFLCFSERMQARIHRGGGGHKESVPPGKTCYLFIFMS